MSAYAHNEDQFVEQPGLNSIGDLRYVLFESLASVRSKYMF